jgi:hypothetical protein
VVLAYDASKIWYCKIGIDIFAGGVVIVGLLAVASVTVMKCSKWL